MNLIKYLSLSAFCATLAGCAAHNTQTHQKVTFYSDETPSVTVTVDGQVIGETDCDAVLSLSDAHEVVFSKTGYKPASQSLVPYEDPDTGEILLIEECWAPELIAEGEVVPPPEPPIIDEPPIDEPPGIEGANGGEGPENGGGSTPVKTTTVGTEEVKTETTGETDTVGTTTGTGEDEGNDNGGDEPDDENETDPQNGKESDNKTNGKDGKIVVDTPPVINPPEPPVVKEPTIPVRPIKALKSELDGLKRMRKLNLISEEDFNTRIEELKKEYSNY